MKHETQKNSTLEMKMTAINYHSKKRNLHRTGQESLHFIRSTITKIFVASLFSWCAFYTYKNIYEYFLRREIMGIKSSRMTDSASLIIHKNNLSNALLGAIVADCATMPLHWIYDSNKLNESIVNEDKTACEFNAVPSCPFYSTKEFPGHYKVGQPSPYGEQLIGTYQLVQKIKANGKDLNGNTYAEGFKKWLSTYGGRKDSVSKAFEEKYEAGETYPNCGIDDDQAMSLYKAVIAFHEASSDNNELELESFVRFLQNNEMALASSQVLLHFLKATAAAPKDPLRNIFDRIKSKVPLILRDHLAFLDRNLHLGTRDFLVAWGEEFRPGAAYYVPISCHNPQALVRILHICLTASSFEEGVRTNILVGGDNASTAIGIGAVLGNHYGIPKGWIDKSIFLS